MTIGDDIGGSGSCLS